MILPLINVTVIPFLLEALVPVKDHREWNFGPEYVFQLNKTIVFKKSFVSEDITAKVKCRPSVSQDVLLCHAHKIILSKTQKMYEHIRENKSHCANLCPHKITEELPDRIFELVFDMQRVQGLTERRRGLDPHLYDIIPDIIEQFNIGLDLNAESKMSMKDYEDKISGKHVISFFTQTNADTMRVSKCNTSVIITYAPSNHSHKDGEYRDHKNKIKFSFHLRLLPISYTNPADKTVSIEKISMPCNYHQPANFGLVNEKCMIDNMIQYFNVMEIRSTKPKFTSRTHLEGYVLFPRSGHKHHFSEDVHFALLRIKPARHELDIT